MLGVSCSPDELCSVQHAGFVRVFQILKSPVTLNRKESSVSQAVIKISKTFQSFAGGRS